MHPDPAPFRPEPPAWTVAEVALDRIDPADETFRITTRPCDDALTASIAAWGPINLPILRAKGEGFGIVSGFRRVEACRRARFSRIAARILSPPPEDAACIRLAVTDNAFQRELNPVEASRIVGLLSRLYPGPGAVAEASTRLGFPLHRTLVEKLAMLGTLPKPVQAAVAEGLVALPVALDLATLDPDVAVSLTALFHRLKPGLNLQREIIRHITEIARRENRGPEDVLKAPELEGIVNDDTKDRVQTCRRIRDYLKKRRFPHLTEREAAFRQWVKRLKPGPGVSLSPPRDFEGTAFSLTLRFDSPEALTARKAAIDRILNDPDLESLFRP